MTGVHHKMVCFDVVLQQEGKSEKSFVYCLPDEITLKFCKVYSQLYILVGIKINTILFYVYLINGCVLKTGS